MTAISLQNTFISEVNFKDIFYDPQVKIIIKSANPLAICRNRKSDFCVDNIESLLMMYPIIGYFKGECFILCSGLFSLNTVIQICKGIDRKISVIALRKKPRPKKIRHLFLIYLANQIVNQLFISNSSQVGFFLNSWFNKDENEKSIQGSKEWLSLFPNLNNKELLVRHLRTRNENL